MMNIKLNKMKEKVFHEDYYKILNKKTKTELIEKIEDQHIEYRKLGWDLDCSGDYQIKIWKNKQLVQDLKFTWSDQPNGANFKDVKDLEHQLMQAYQDYQSLVESQIIFNGDWDER